MERIKTTDISTASGTQMRAAIDMDTVNDYATCLDSLPPIVVFYDGSRYYCADGFHRIEAHRLSGRTDIACDVRSGTLRDAILFAAGANASHGKRRSNADKRRAIETLLRDEEWRSKSDRWIADVVKVGVSLVGSVRYELFPVRQVSENTPDKPSGYRVVQGQDGKTYTVPQRPAQQPPRQAATPAQRPSPVIVTEEPATAPRVTPKQKEDDGFRQGVDRLVQVAAMLSDAVDDLLAGDFGDFEDARDGIASSLDLSLTHLRQAIEQAGG